MSAYPLFRSCLRAALLAGLWCSVGVAQTTYVAITSSGSKAGIDSYYVGNQVTLGYVVTSGGPVLEEIDFPVQMSFTAGNIVGPVHEGGTGFSFNPPAISQFAVLEFDSTYGAEATDPDTLYWYATGGTGYGGTLAYLRFTPQSTGTIAIDSVRLPSGAGMSVRDSAGGDVSFTWIPKTIHVVPAEVRFRVRARTTSGYEALTLLAGQTYRLSFEVECTGAVVGAIDWPARFHFSNGNLIGPLAEGVSAVPGADAGLFDSALWAGQYDNATDPDTTRLRFVSNAGVLLKGTYRLWTIEFTPADTGLIIPDTLTLPPAIALSATDQSGSPLAVSWGPRTIPVVAAYPEFQIKTQFGTDTMFAHQEGSIIFYLHAAGWNLAGVTMPLKFTFGGAGNLIGPVGEDFVDSARFIYSDYAKSAMENLPFQSILGNDFKSDPDTLLFGALDFNGDGWDADTELARITFTPTGAGTIQILNTFVPPACCVSLLDQNADDVPFGFHEPYTITVLPCPVMMGDVNNDAVINSGDLIYMVNYIFKSGPDPIPMRTVGDANCSGGLGGSDIIYLVNYIFKGGQPPCECYVRII